VVPTAGLVSAGTNPANAAVAIAESGNAAMNGVGAAGSMQPLMATLAKANEETWIVIGADLPLFSSSRFHFLLNSNLINEHSLTLGSSFLFD
jgi:hypothetical protein